MTRYRTRAGQLSASTLKAINWYAIDRGLKLTASSAFPQVTFIDGDGGRTTVHINDVIEAYGRFKERSHGKSGA